MAQTVVDCWNQAISAIGNRGADIKSLNDKRSPAEECRRWYPTVRDSVLRAAYWQSVKTTVSLDMQSSALDSAVQVQSPREKTNYSGERKTVPWQPHMPEPPWAFAYAPPDNMLHPRYIRDFQLFAIGSVMPAPAASNGASALPAVTDGTGTVPALFSNERPTILTYTRREENPELWEADLFVAISMTLATFIASALSGRFEWYRKAREQAQEAVARANIVQRDIESSRGDTVIADDPAPPWLRARMTARHPQLSGAPVTEVQQVGTQHQPFFLRPPDLVFGTYNAATGR